MAPSIVHNAFPSIMRVGKEERISQADSRSLILLSCAQTLYLLPSHLRSPPSSRSKPPRVAMALNLSPTHLRSDSDLRKVRLMLGWKLTEYDGRMRCRSVLLSGLWPGEFIFFTSYALAGLTLSMSSFFFFTLLENYGLQLHHLSPHSFTLVAIFVHLCEIYVGVRSSVRLFCLFHVLRSSGRSASRTVPTTSSTGARVQL
jgi:hypothetical protein